MVHTGDIVNWDTPDHPSTRPPRDAFVPLEEAGIPYSLSVGNHDTAAVCPGGSACDPARTYAAASGHAHVQPVLRSPVGQP